MSRRYDMTNRARGAAETRERILDVTEELFATVPFKDVTLQSIAQGSGVTVQTVLRHMGSRDGCFEAMARRLGSRVDKQRGHTAPGDVEAAVDEVLAHYEAEGRIVLSLLGQERSDPQLADAVAIGRAQHRAWVERAFGPRLGTQPSEGTVDSLVLATDIYVWKLLRLDLGRSLEATREIVVKLVRALLAAS